MSVEFFECRVGGYFGMWDDDNFIVRGVGVVESRFCGWIGVLCG